MENSSRDQHDSGERDTILKVEGISKAFPGVQALDKVSIDVKEGEILAVLGENGAGKSTLMKILSGLYKPDEGIIHVNRSWFQGTKTNGKLEQIALTDPRMAMLLGIGMVYQHFQLVGPFTVTENITLGQEYTYKNTILLQIEHAEDEIKKISEEYGLPIDPHEKVENLPVGLKQRVEILKQLYRKAELLILDEPTSVLTPSEVEELFRTIRDLKKTGKSIIFISHKLKEALAIADRIVVLRKGKVVGETYPDQIKERELAEMLVGRPLVTKLDRDDVSFVDVVLDVNELTLIDESQDSEQVLLDNISFQVNRNQIVGVAGVQGNGQTELLDTLVGMRKPTSGSVYYFPKSGGGINLLEKTTLQILRSGIAYIPEDRTMQGLILDFNLINNSWMAFHSSKEKQLEPIQPLISDEDKSAENDIDEIWKKIKPFVSKLFLPLEVMKHLARKIVRAYEVQTTSIDSSLRSLSGGNQQKVLVGREFAKNPELIIAAQPTRGVDIGVMEKIHQELIKKRNEGTAVLLISSDLDEILKISDYIIVMYEGKIAGRGDTSDLTISQISEYMTTGKYTEDEEEEKEEKK